MEFLAYLLYFIAAIVFILGVATAATAQNKALDKQQIVKAYSFIAALLFMGGCWAAPSESPSKEDVSKMDGSAFVMSEDFVKARLKSPSSADFPSGTDGHVTYLGDSIYMVKSYVDSQNSFGAMLRSDYTAKIKYIGNDKWQAIEVNLTER